MPLLDSLDVGYGFEIYFRKYLQFLQYQEWPDHTLLLLSAGALV